MELENKDIEKKIVIKYDENKVIRLDKYLSLVLHEKYNIDLTREKLKKKILDKEILVNGGIIKPSYILKKGDEISYLEMKEKEKIIPQNLKKCVYDNIIYEDDDIIVLDKPKGIIVHSGSNTNITLVDILKEKYDLYGQEGREGIVHRLDKNTSGLMVISKTKKAYDNLVIAFKDRKIQKKYYAIAEGIILEKAGIIDMPIIRDKIARHKMKVDKEGKKAKTKFNVISYIKDKYTFLDIQIYTGRTHQIRVHFAKIGHPILGDDIYGKRSNEYNIQGQVLQSYFLEFNHPITNEKMTFKLKPNTEISSILES